MGLVNLRGGRVVWSWRVERKDDGVYSYSYE